MKLLDVSTPKYPNTFAMVDDEDFDRLSAYKWSAHQGHPDWPIYAVRSFRFGKKQICVRMHREIVGNPAPPIIDHRDGNGLNNTRRNLRRATAGESSWNICKPRRGVTSKYKGVSRNNHTSKFQAKITYQGKKISLGGFVDEKEAAKAYDREAIKLFGEFARLNFPLPPAIVSHGDFGSQDKQAQKEGS